MLRFDNVVLNEYYYNYYCHKKERANRCFRRTRRRCRLADEKAYDQVRLLPMLLLYLFCQRTYMSMMTDLYCF